MLTELQRFDQSLKQLAKVVTAIPASVPPSTPPSSSPEEDDPLEDDPELVDDPEPDELPVELPVLVEEPLTLAAELEVALVVVELLLFKLPLDEDVLPEEEPLVELHEVQPPELVLEAVLVVVCRIGVVSAEPQARDNMMPQITKMFLVMVCIESPSARRPGHKAVCFVLSLYALFKGVFAVFSYRLWHHPMAISRISKYLTLRTFFLPFAYSLASNG